MDKIQSEFEVDHIPEAVSLSFEDFDFVVEPLQRAGGNAVFEVSQ